MILIAHKSKIIAESHNELLNILHDTLLDDTLIIHEDGRDTEAMMDEGISNMDAFIAVTGRSETNILTAMIARKNGWNVADYIQGDTEVNEMIRTNSSRDFDLSLEYDYVKDLMKIVDEEDPVQKERYIDAFKWVWLDEQTFFNPFSIEAVFAYLCKLEMLQRWERLDPEQGKATFERIIDELRGEARVPAEFKV